MKRMLSLLMALAMMLSLAACGGGDAPAENTGDGAETQEPAEGGTSGVEDGVLTIAMECAYAPYNWTQMRRLQRRRAHLQGLRRLCQRL